VNASFVRGILPTINNSFVAWDVRERGILKYLWILWLGSLHHNLIPIPYPLAQVEESARRRRPRPRACLLVLRARLSPLRARQTSTTMPSHRLRAQARMCVVSPCGACDPCRPARACARRRQLRWPRRACVHSSDPAAPSTPPTMPPQPDVIESIPNSSAWCGATQHKISDEGVGLVMGFRWVS